MDSRISLISRILGGGRRGRMTMEEATPQPDDDEQCQRLFAALNVPPTPAQWKLFYSGLSMQSLQQLEINIRAPKNMDDKAILVLDQYADYAEMKVIILLKNRCTHNF